ncbi:hypothetical protein C8Q75DRAFT_263835 [Abortiporus biennis]|nr:hypothetical protein C8Q75DRAFT_263835 [Abortiporus biennis]
MQLKNAPFGNEVAIHDDTADDLASHSIHKSRSPDKKTPATPPRKKKKNALDFDSSPIQSSLQSPALSERPPPMTPSQWASSPLRSPRHDHNEQDIVQPKEEPGSPMLIEPMELDQTIPDDKKVEGLPKPSSLPKSDIPSSLNTVPTPPTPAQRPKPPASSDESAITGSSRLVAGWNVLKSSFSGGPGKPSMPIGDTSRTGTIGSNSQSLVDSQESRISHMSDSPPKGARPPFILNSQEFALPPQSVPKVEETIEIEVAVDQSEKESADRSASTSNLLQLKSQSIIKSSHEQEDVKPRSDDRDARYSQSLSYGGSSQESRERSLERDRQEVGEHTKEETKDASSEVDVPEDLEGGPLEDERFIEGEDDRGRSASEQNNEEGEEIAATGVRSGESLTDSETEEERGFAVGEEVKSPMKEESEEEEPRKEEDEEESQDDVHTFSGQIVDEEGDEADDEVEVPVEDTNFAGDGDESEQMVVDAIGDAETGDEELDSDDARIHEKLTRTSRLANEEPSQIEETDSEPEVLSIRVRVPRNGSTFSSETGEEEQVSRATSSSSKPAIPSSPDVFLSEDSFHGLEMKQEVIPSSVRRKSFSRRTKPREESIHPASASTSAVKRPVAKKRALPKEILAQLEMMDSSATAEHDPNSWHHPSFMQEHHSSTSPVGKTNPQSHHLSPQLSKQASSLRRRKRALSHSSTDDSEVGDKRTRPVHKKRKIDAPKFVEVPSSPEHSSRPSSKQLIPQLVKRQTSSGLPRKHSVDSTASKVKQIDFHRSSSINSIVSTTKKLSMRQSTPAEPQLSEKAAGKKRAVEVTPSISAKQAERRSSMQSLAHPPRRTSVASTSRSLSSGKQDRPLPALVPPSNALVPQHSVTVSSPSASANPSATSLRGSSTRPVVLGGFKVDLDISPEDGIYCTDWELLITMLKRKGRQIQRSSGDGPAG